MSNFSLPYCCCDCYDNDYPQPPAAVNQSYVPPRSNVHTQSPFVLRPLEASEPDIGSNLNSNNVVGNNYPRPSAAAVQINRNDDGGDGGVPAPYIRERSMPQKFVDETAITLFEVRNPTENCHISDAIKRVNLDTLIGNFLQGSNFALSVLSYPKYTIQYVLVLFDDDQRKANAIGDAFCATRFTTYPRSYCVENEHKPSAFIKALNHFYGFDPNYQINALIDNIKALVLAVVVYSSSNADITILTSFPELPDLHDLNFLRRMKGAENSAIVMYKDVVEMRKRAEAVVFLNSCARDTSRRMARELERLKITYPLRPHVHPEIYNIYLSISVTVFAPKWYTIECDDSKKQDIENRRFEFRMDKIPHNLHEKETTKCLLNGYATFLTISSEYKIDENPGMSLWLNGQSIDDWNTPLVPSLTTGYSLEAMLEFHLTLKEPLLH